MTKDNVNHPAHYGGAGNIYECIKVIEAWGLGFCLGNAVKYISRAGKKGDALEDLKKARWYLDRAIAEREQSNQAESNSLPPPPVNGNITRAEALVDLSKMLGLGATPTQDALVRRWRVTKGRVSKWVSLWEAQQNVRRARSARNGRYKVICGISQREKREG